MSDILTMEQTTLKIKDDCTMNRIFLTDLFIDFKYVVSCLNKISYLNIKVVN